MPTHSTALVLGYGNVQLGDDGAGIRVMEGLKAQVDAECFDGGTMNFDLLAHVETAASLLVIDAANIQLPAGALALFEGHAMDGFLACARRHAMHEDGLMDLLGAARLLGCLPQRRALLCLQPKRIAQSTSLSAPLEQALGEAMQLAKKWLNHRRRQRGLAYGQAVSLSRLSSP